MATTFDDWIQALEARHLTNLSRSELTRGLRALSSCYIERRHRLMCGAALEGAGKRAAFALFYAPIHFLTVTSIVRALGAEATSARAILDLGCGTGAAGAGWALACSGSMTVTGVDRNPWAVSEANWTYNQLGIRGSARIGDVLTPLAHGRRGADVLLAYVVNELRSDTRVRLLQRVVEQARSGSRILIVEPIARRLTDWWGEWSEVLSAVGGRADEWRFRATLPDLLRAIAKGAGLGTTELTARTIFIGRRST